MHKAADARLVDMLFVPPESSGNDLVEAVARRARRWDMEQGCC